MTRITEVLHIEMLDVDVTLEGEEEAVLSVLNLLQDNYPIDKLERK